MMRNLVVPDALPGFEIHAHNRIAEQIAARPVTAVIIVGRRFDREICTPQLRIDRDGRPHTGVAGIRVGFSLPGFRAELSIFRHCVKGPFLFAATRIESHHVSRRVAHRIGRETLFERGRDDDRVAIDHRRRAVADARHMIEVDVQLLHEIDRAVRAERFHGHAGLRVKGDEIEARRDDEDPLVFTVCPIGDASSCISPRCLAIAAAFVHSLP